MKFEIRKRSLKKKKTSISRNKVFQIALNGEENSNFARKNFDH